MTLKCSVFGHQFKDADVTREREEQGSEVVITITETETCARCGETRVVSENKEVTTLETPSDIVGEDVDAAPEDSDEDDRGAQDSTETSPETTVPAGTEATDAIEDAESTTPAAGDSTGSVTPPGGRDPEEEDAVILDDESDSEEREPGEWPQDDDEPEDDWTPDTDTPPGELPDVESEQPDVTSTSEAVTVPDGEFHCPECGFTTAVESSSLREGDFCPECHRGTLRHEPSE